MNNHCKIGLAVAATVATIGAVYYLWKNCPCHQKAKESGCACGNDCKCTPPCTCNAPKPSEEKPSEEKPECSCG